MRRQGSGFTLIEMLIVIAIISILAALLLPALQNAQSAALSSSCQNNLKQTGMIIQTYAGENNNFAPVAGFGYGGGIRIWYQSVMRLAYGLDCSNGATRKPYQLKNSSIIYCPSDDISWRTLYDVTYSYAANYTVSPEEQSAGSWFFTRPRKLTAFKSPSKDVYLLDNYTTTAYAWCGISPLALTSTHPTWSGGRLTTATAGGYRQHQEGFNAQWIDGHVSREAYLDMEGKVTNQDYFRDSIYN